MQERDAPHRDRPMSLWAHVEELRRRLILAAIGLLVALVASMAFGREIQEFLIGPYERMMAEAGQEPTLYIQDMSEGFILYFRVCLHAALVLGGPWILYQIWLFVAAGLHDRERRAVMIAVPFSGLLFVGGALFFVFVGALPLLRLALSCKPLVW